MEVFGSDEVTDVFELMRDDGLLVELVDQVPSEDVLSINTPEQLAEVESACGGLLRQLGYLA